MFSLAAVTAILAAVYVSLAVYYQNGFSYGTWINGVYCTGKSIDDVNGLLTAKFSYPGMTVTDADKSVCRISAEDIDYKFDFKKALKIYLDQQNSWLWPENIAAGRQRTLLPVVTYDDKLLEKCIADCPEVRDAVKNPPEVKLYLSDKDGYVLINNSTKLLNVARAVKAVKSGIRSSKKSVDLNAAGCYYDLNLTPEMKNDIELYSKINSIQDQDIEYIFGTQREKIGPGTACGFIKKNSDGSIYTDKEGKPAVDEDIVKDYIKGLASKYNTVGITRTFHATNGRTVSILGGTYGNMIDKDAEYKLLSEELSKRERVSREPVYKQKAKLQGTHDDIGNTYIEVDMSDQKMYYYLDGVLKLSTEVVTGDVGRDRATPAGVDFVAVKQKDRILKGDTYQSHVNFWMQVYKGIGIHDSAWRDEYGGAIYMTEGSHGCVNTPYSAMKELYNETEIDTPVVMFY